MVGTLAQNQGSARLGGQNVFHQVGQVDGLPNLASLRAGLRIVHLCIGSKVRARLTESGMPQLQEALDVPMLNVIDARIDVDREVEKVRDH